MPLKIEGKWYIETKNKKTVFIQNELPTHLISQHQSKNNNNHYLFFSFVFKCDYNNYESSKSTLA